MGVYKAQQRASDFSSIALHTDKLLAPFGLLAELGVVRFMEYNAEITKSLDLHSQAHR